MKRDYKKVYIYGIIMLACVIVIVIIGLLSEKKISGYEADYQNLITANQNSIRILEEENTELKRRNKELEEQLSDALLFKSDVETVNQAMNDLKDIYDDYKAGKLDKAKDAFKKIEPMGFDDTSLMYYEILKDLLEK